MIKEKIENNIENKICIECHRQFTGIISACPHDGTSLVDLLNDPMLGTTLANNYEILSIIGHGAMGVVYKAKHLLMDRYVAIKMLHSSLITNSDNYRRLQQEGKATSKLHHPNIINMYDFNIAPSGQPYIVMDYIEGTDLNSLIKQKGNVSVEDTINYLSQVCDGLAHAHKQGVIHRDLKPTNIMLIGNPDESVSVKVVDFGVAKVINQSSSEAQKLTKVGEICGSPIYMSPEQCQGFELDNRSDIYSLGVVLFETLTGQIPFLGQTSMETMAKHLNAPIPTLAQTRPDLYYPEKLDSVIAIALAKDPKSRFTSMEEFKMALKNSVPKPANNVNLRAITQHKNNSPLSLNKIQITLLIISFILLIAVFMYKP